MNELNMIRALLEEPPPSAEVIAEGHQRIAAGSTRQRPRRPWWALAVAGVAVAAAAAAITLADTVSVPGTPAVPPRGSVGSRTPSGPATTASGILRNAALTALETPANAPSPGQFVYTKIYRYQQASGAGVVRTWGSVDGTRLGLEAAGTTRAAFPACRDGFWLLKPIGQLAYKSKARCSPAGNAAYLPAMPTSPAALRAYLHQLFGLDPGDSGGLLTNIETMMTTDYLTPRQLAALYRLLAQTPGLTVVPHVSNVRGQTGVGVRARAYTDIIYTIIFDRATYAPLGMNWNGIAGPLKGTRNGEVVVNQAIVSNTPPLP
jgi:hypothetical protein